LATGLEFEQSLIPELVALGLANEHSGVDIIGQSQSRQGLATGSAGHRAIRVKDDVKDHAVVGRIAVMTVGIPFALVNVHFDIAPPQVGVGKRHQGIGEVRSRAMSPTAAIHTMEGLSVDSSQALPGEELGTPELAD
jgi:hypothetical protein